MPESKSSNIITTNKIYAGRIDSRKPYDYEFNTPVPVIASFNKLGEIRPLYVRVNNLAMPVISFYVKARIANVLDFNCKIDNQGTILPLLLTYYQIEGIWTITR